jgi:hypothetical protein
MREPCSVAHDARLLSERVTECVLEPVRPGTGPSGNANWNQFWLIAF